MDEKRWYSLWPLQEREEEEEKDKNTWLDGTLGPLQGNMNTYITHNGGDQSKNILTIFSSSRLMAFSLLVLETFPTGRHEKRSLPGLIPG